MQLLGILLIFRIVPTLAYTYVSYRFPHIYWSVSPVMDRDLTPVVYLPVVIKVSRLDELCDLFIRHHLAKPHHQLVDVGRSDDAISVLVDQAEGGLDVLLEVVPGRLSSLLYHLLVPFQLVNVAIG